MKDKLSWLTKEIFIGEIVPSLVLIGMIMGIITYASYLYGQNTNLKVALESAQKDLSNLSANLASTTAEKNNLSNQISAKQAEALAANDRANQIFTAVSVLKKLNETDKELLQKYSKVYFLNENYIPASLATIASSSVFGKDRFVQVHNQVDPFLTSLINQARSEGVDITVLSAYRSFNAQSSLKKTYQVTYGAGTANKFSADQGYSEHQLGTAIDFTTSKIGSGLTGFEKTPAYAWLLANGYRYGFVISYPKDNKFYVYEPWHWRFVGIKLATLLHDQGKFFYDLDQRQIDQYLVNIFD